MGVTSKSKVMNLVRIQRLQCRLITVSGVVKLTHPVLVVLGLAAIAFGTGCASKGPELGSRAPGEKVDLAKSEPGIIVITPTAGTAEIQFDPPNNRMESASEGAESAARSVLNTPNLGHPQIEAAFGVVGFALSPFAAAYGAISAGQRRLSTDKISEAERELGEAMRTNSSPENLVQKLGEAGRERTHRLLVCADSTAAKRMCEGSANVSAVLEVGVEHLWLKALQPGGDEYALSMAVHARLVRQADQRILLERTFRYQSGPAFYIDWARHTGLESVAQTGYAILAEQIAEEVFKPVSRSPILIGPGNRHSQGPGVAPDPWSGALFGAPGEFWFSSSPVFQLVSSLEGGRGSIEIYTRSTNGFLIFPKSTGEPDPNIGGQTETEYAFDGLVNDRNSIVQYLSCLTAVPMGIWEQTIGAFRKISQGRTERAGAALKFLVTQRQFEQELTDAVTRGLQSQAAETINPAEKPVKLGFASTAESGKGEAIRPGRPEKTALELQVVSTELVGKHKNSKSRALVVEIQATLIRTSDGQELYSCPVHYRSIPRKIKDWTGTDAKLLREELSACSEETAQALTKELLRSHLVTPKQKAGPAGSERL